VRAGIGSAVASGEKAKIARLSIVGVAMVVLGGSQSLGIFVQSLSFKFLGISPAAPAVVAYWHSPL